MATVDEIIEQIEKLSVLDLVKLTKELQEKWGVSAAAAMPAMVMAAPVGGAGAAPVEEAPTEFNVILTGLADASKKVNVIKVVRELTSLGLGEAKAVVEGAPKTVNAAVLSKEDAEAMMKKLVEGGATAEVKPA